MLKAQSSYCQSQVSSTSSCSSYSNESLSFYSSSKQELKSKNSPTLIEQFNQLKKNIQAQLKKNKALFNQNLKLDNNFQHILHVPSKKNQPCSKQGICELLKQIDILLQEQNFLKKQKHIALMREQMIKQNQQNQWKNCIDQYLFLRNLWGTSKQQKKNINNLRVDQQIQDLNKKVVLLKKNIQQISKKEKDFSNQQQFSHKNNSLFKLRAGKFQHQSSLNALNQKINELVTQTFPFQRLKEQYEQTLMQNQQLKSRINLSLNLKQQKADGTKILQQKIIFLQEQNSFLRKQNLELTQRIRVSQMREFQNLLKINQIEEKIYQKQRQLEKFLYEEMNTLKKYQILDEDNQSFYQLTITKIKRLSKQSQKEHFQFQLNQIQEFLKTKLKNKKIEQIFNGEDQKKQQLRKCLSSGLLKKQQIDIQQEYAKQKFRTLKKDSSRASLNQMRKHMAGVGSDKISEDIKKNKFVRTSLTSPTYKKSQQLQISQIQNKNCESQKLISQFKSEQLQPQYEIQKSQYRPPSFLFQKSHQNNLKKQKLKRQMNGQCFFSSKRN